MSFGQHAQSKHNFLMLSVTRVQVGIRIQLKLCVECKERRPVFFRKGFKHIAKRDRDHKLCMRCWRAQLNRMREK